MAEEKGTAAYQDMLDIIFADRNKAYGAYQLRRTYPKYIGRALLFGLLLIAFLFSIPTITRTVTGALKREKPIAVTAELGPPPDIDPDHPAPPPPPPPPTPPPPVRATQAFVPPVIKKNEEVADDETPEDVNKLLADPADIGKTNQEGSGEDIPPPLDPNQNTDAFGDEGNKPAPPPEKTYELFDIQKQPSFPGGEPALMKYLAEQIKYPPLARENNIQGVVALTFVINKDGSVSDVAILKDIGGGCGKEAVRVVNEMQKWIPGEANGHPVKVRYTLPVRFQLQ